MGDVLRNDTLGIAEGVLRFGKRDTVLRAVEQILLRAPTRNSPRLYRYVIIKYGENAIYLYVSQLGPGVSNLSRGKSAADVGGRLNLSC